MPDTERTVGGVPVGEIAAEFGTPVYVYDAEILRSGYRRLRAAIPDDLGVLYSLKANPNLSVCAVLRAEGAGAEVSSESELVTALRAGVDPRDVLFLGPGKSLRELRSCLENGVGGLVCESFDELERIDVLAGELGIGPARVLLRVNPAFTASGSGLAMGGKPRQFGIDEALLLDARARIAGLRHVVPVGVHAYMGTRFLDEGEVVRNTERILETAERLGEALGIPLECVDVGGGLGVAYFANESDPDVAALGRGLERVLRPFRRRHPDCRVLMELGRHLTAHCGLYVTRVVSVKESHGELFAVADGGTNHHMAAVGTGGFAKRNFPITHLTPSGRTGTRRYSVSGPLCTPGDLIAKRVTLPPVAPGDLIGVERSGAYGPTASPGLFLSHGHPAEVLVDDGRAMLVRERDTTADLLAKQHLVAPVAP